MKRHVEFTRAAKRDFDAAADWYEQRAKRLGERFARAVQRLVRRIVANPKLFAVVYREVRQASVRGFPFTLFYREKNDRLIVLAVVHTSRDPQIWMDRVDNELRDE
ncbi:MAG: type II toxin-antitoxin system RelE/ParE family toxin [Planctomycetota bacterium]|nr:MAG: type II toxin-antitoxin system RelE/ParE family toxin [Planctomycetota bacterium]